MAGLYVALIALGVLPPFVPFWGPLSADDVLPVLAVLLGLGWALRTRFRPRLEPWGWALLAFGLVGVASSLANADSASEGLRLLLRSSGRMLFALLLIGLARALIDSPAKARQALQTFAAVATLESVFSVLAWLFSWQGPYSMGVQTFSRSSHLYGSDRVQGTFGGVAGAYELAVHAANFLAAYLLLGCLVTAGLLYAARSRNERVSWMAALALQLVSLLLTYTRAALIALAGGALAFGWLLGKRRPALAALLAGALCVLAVPAFRAKFFDSHNRYALYAAALAIIRDHPLLGVGDGRYEQVLFAHPEYRDTVFGPASSTAHNSLLQSAAHHGLPGALAHVALYATIGLGLARVLRRTQGSERKLAAGVAAALVALLIQDQMNNLLYVPKVITQAWLLFGVVAGLAAPNGPAAPSAGDPSADPTGDKRS